MDLAVVKARYKKLLFPSNIDTDYFTPLQLRIGGIIGLAPATLTDNTA